MAEIKDIATWLVGFLRDHVTLKDDALRGDLVDAWKRLTGADEPSEPIVPAEPTVPTEPVVPAEPVEPTEPVVPEQPVAPPGSSGDSPSA